MEFTYEQIKQLAKESGRKVTDLIALAAQNDPFYQGTPAQREKAEWFAEIYHRQGWRYTRNHIRRCHYQILSLGLTLPNGKPYENTEACWDLLNVASKAARYLGLVDMASFDDRRNAEPINHARPLYEPAISIYDYLYTSDIQVPEFPTLPYYGISDYQGNQPYHLEVWCEKTTMNDILEPLCQEYGMVLQTASGEQSITAARLLAERLEEHQKPTRVFYVSDFDPAGQSMPGAVARKLEFFVRNRLDMPVDVRLFPVVLTEEQTKQYRLPRVPIKETERRRDHFEQQHGEGATELDALEALRPGELERIMRCHIEQYYDTGLDAQVREMRAELEQALQRAQRDVLNAHQAEINAAKQELAEIARDFSPRMATYAAHVRQLWQAISADMQEAKPDLEEYPLPEASRVSELGAGLYNSRRSYLDQIDAYKQFQGK